MDTNNLIVLIRDDRLAVVREVARESTLSGTKELYQDKLADPATMDAVRRVWLIFKTNFLMAVAGNPHRELLQVTAQQLDDLYRFVDGPLVGSSVPPPGPLVMMRAERAMWQELAIAVHMAKNFLRLCRPSS